MMAHSISRTSMAMLLAVAATAVAACDTQRVRRSDSSNGLPGTVAAIKANNPAEFTLTFAGNIPEFGADSSIARRRPNVIAGMFGALLSESVAAIANYDHVLLHNFSSNKSVVVGRRGDGPGEFRQISYIYRTASGFAVADNSAKAMLQFTASGDYRSTTVFPFGGPIGWLDNMGPVARRGGLTTPNAYTSFDSTGKIVRELLSLPPFLDLTLWVEEDGGTANLNMGWACDPPLLHAVIGSTLFVVDQKSASVLAVDMSGNRRTVFTRDSKGRVTSAMHANIRKTFARAKPADVEALLERFGAPGQSLYVTWDWMVADPAGGIFLRYSSCINSGERIWDWIDTSGVHRGTLTSNRHIIAAYKDYLLVRGEDSTGVPEVSRWKVTPNR